MTIYEYIQKYQHAENYLCECIILPDGSVEEPSPSHIEKLIELSNHENIWLKKHMSAGMEPLFWMNEFTGCVCVWKTRIVAPSRLTKEQEAAIELLYFAAFLSPKYAFEQADESYAKSVSISRKEKLLSA